MENKLVGLIKNFLENYKKEDGIANRKMIEKYSIPPDVLEDIYGGRYKNIVAKG